MNFKLRIRFLGVVSGLCGMLAVPASANLNLTFKLGDPGAAVLEIQDSESGQNEHRVLLQKLEGSSCVEFSEKGQVWFEVCQAEGGMFIKKNNTKTDETKRVLHEGLATEENETWKETSLGSETVLTWQRGKTLRTITKKVRSNTITFFEEDKILAEVDLRSKNPKMILFTSQALDQAWSFLPFWSSLWSPYLLTDEEVNIGESQSDVAPLSSLNFSPSFDNQSSSVLTNIGIGTSIVGAAAAVSLGCYVLYKWMNKKSHGPSQGTVTHISDTGDAQSESVFRERIVEFLENYRRHSGGETLALTSHWRQTDESEILDRFYFSEEPQGHFLSWKAELGVFSKTDKHRKALLEFVSFGRTLRVTIEETSDETTNGNLKVVTLLTHCPLDAQTAKQILTSYL